MYLQIKMSYLFGFLFPTHPMCIDHELQKVNARGNYTTDIHDSYQKWRAPPCPLDILASEMEALFAKATTVQCLGNRILTQTHLQKSSSLSRTDVASLSSPLHFCNHSNFFRSSTAETTNCSGCSCS